jgi:hypothetical protein
MSESNKNEEFWLRKMKFYFNEVLDVNSDGVVNETDMEMFELIFKKMKNIQSEDSQMFVNFKNFLNTWFTAIMRGDKNSDKSITLEVNSILIYFKFTKRPL